MQRPGCRLLAISVSTLTEGSQATAFLLSFERRNSDAGDVLRASCESGIRTSTEVSGTLSTWMEIVRVATVGSGRIASRSALAARLTTGAA